MSFALDLPEMLMEIKLPYLEEYLSARGKRYGENLNQKIFFHIK